MISPLLNSLLPWREPADRRDDPLRLLALLVGVGLVLALPATAAVIAVDAAHGNYHTAGERYAPFAALAREAGHEVVDLDAPFAAEALARIDVLVIANALAAANRERWELPTPSAFTPAEIDAVHAWVAGGGSLLLIADHMPFGGAAAELAARFGVTMENGFAFGPGGEGTIAFQDAAGTLALHPITAGLPPGAGVVSFTGQAFEVTPGIDASPLLILPDGCIQLLPERAWDFSDATPRHEAGGWLQGAALLVGEGRVAVFGEAAMFTSQSAGPDQPPVGFEHPDAPGNRTFIAGVLGWLSGELPAR